MFLFELFIILLLDFFFFARIYRINFLQYANIWKDEIHSVGESEFTIKSSFNQLINYKFLSQLVNGLHNIKPMFRKPLSFYLILLCVMDFFTMALVNTIRLWFPQISTIVEHSAGIDGNSEFCDILDAYTQDLKITAVNVTVNEVCSPTRSGTETYVNSMILGCVSMAPYALSGILVNKVGKKLLIISAGALTIVITIILIWSSSRIEVVGLFAADMAIGLAIMSLLQATIVEEFPTSTRTLAVSLVLTTGRIGTMVANVVFPILLDIGCIIPFYTLAGTMVCVTILAFFLPTKKKN